MLLAAAFVRLCVETVVSPTPAHVVVQPPSCGCVLKLSLKHLNEMIMKQPPSCGCVLKRQYVIFPAPEDVQPPSCGCVLKLFIWRLIKRLINAAAFVRLCVETIFISDSGISNWAAAFVRLCVETKLWL